MNKSLLLAVTGAFLFSAATVQAAQIHTYWAFQAATNSPAITGEVTAGNAAVAGIYSGTAQAAYAAPNAESWTGTPTFFAASSLALRGFTPSGPNFTDYEGTLWNGGPNLSWNVSSSNNTFMIGFDMTNAVDFNVRFDYRLTSGGVMPFSALEYSVGGGAFTSVGTADSINGNSTWNSWSLDLSSLSAIEGESDVRIRWNIGDLPAGRTFRLDNVQMSATLIPEPSAYGMLGLAGLGIILMRRRRSNL